MSDAGCRELCRLRSEPLAGSASSAPLWVGIGWPKPLWHPDEVAHSSGLPPEIARLEGEAAARGTKLALRLFQRGVAPPRDRVEVLLFGRDRAALSLPAVPLERLAETISAFVAGASLAADASPMSPQILVCTDGKHDACCARYGWNLYTALSRAAAGAGEDVSVAETSHLGGHRFAACCLALPSGHLYGRVDASDASRLLRAVVSGEVVEELSRGEIGHAEVCQVARAAARRAGYTPAGRDEVHLDGARATVRVAVGRDGDPARVVVHCERRSFAGVNSCGADATVEANERWVERDLALE